MDVHFQYNKYIIYSIGKQHIQTKYFQLQTQNIFQRKTLNIIINFK